MLHLRKIHSIGHEPTLLNKHLELIDGGDPMRGREIHDGPSVHEHRRSHQYSLVLSFPHAEESGSQIPPSAYDDRVNLYAEGPSCGSGLLIVPSEYLRECRGCDILTKERDL